MSVSQPDRAADVQRADPALVVRRDGDGVEDPLDLVLAEPVGEQALARGGLDERLRARARGDALRGDADQPLRAGLAGHRDAVQRVDLLGGDAAVRGRLVLGVARLEVDLGAPGALAVAHLLGDVLGQRLGAERALAEDDLADRVVDDLLEARHVRALLARAQIDEAVELRGVQSLVSACVDPYDLLDVRHAYARERDVERGDLVLDVLEGYGHGMHDRRSSSSPLRGTKFSPARCFRFGTLVLQVTFEGCNRRGRPRRGRLVFRLKD